MEYGYRTCSDLITEIFMNIKTLHHSFSHVKQMSSCQYRLYIFLVGSVCVSFEPAYCSAEVNGDIDISGIVL